MSVKMGWFHVIFISLCVFKELYVQCAVAEGNCQLPDHDQCAILPDVCQDASLSHQLCPHVCGFCASAVTTGTSQPTTTLPTTTATPTPKPGTKPFQWTSDHSDGAVKYMCRGQDLYLPVTYTLAQGQQVSSIQWYFKGQSEEIVAMVTSHGQFVPMPAFANRVEFVPPAGIVVKNVVPSDSGNYTVEVISHAINTFSDQRLTFVVDVTGIVSPSSDHDVLTMERSAVYNATTDQWAIGLTCGKMSSLGQPPVDVVWTTPTGERKASTSFRNGSFLLTLDNPVKGGNYSCSIDPSSPAKACLSGSSGLLQRADVIVDEELAILILKEARQEAEITRLQHQNQELTSQATNLTSQVHSLTSQATSLTSQVHSLTSQVHSLEATDANLASYIERLEHNLTHCIQNTVIRLAGSSNSFEGRVEIKINGVWGTVCDYHWTANDAKVVCRQLGLPTGNATPRYSATFGRGSDPIHLDEVHCVGTESNLLDCPRDFAIDVVPNCHHGADAGVTCA